MKEQTMIVTGCTAAGYPLKVYGLKGKICENENKLHVGDPRVLALLEHRI